MGVPAVAKALGALSSLLSPSAEGGRAGGLAALAAGAAALPVLAGFALLSAPIGLWDVATDAAGGRFADAGGGSVLLGVRGGGIEADRVRHYSEEQERLERWARGRWPDEGGSSVYELPSWQWLWALDSAMSGNDFGLVESNRARYEAVHERALKAVRQTRVDLVPRESSDEPDGAEGLGASFDEEAGVWRWTEEVASTYWRVSCRTFADMFASSGGAVLGSLSQEFKYYAAHESADYGGGWGDGGNALGYYQFDRRYGLDGFIAFCLSEAPGAFPMLEPWSAGPIAQGDPALERSWIAAYAADPALFAELQDRYEYDSYYLPGERLLGEMGFASLPSRRDCVKGLVCGLVNLNGPGGARRYFEAAALDDSMSDEEVARALCGAMIANPPGNAPQAYASRYAAELEEVLDWLSRPPEGAPGEPGSEAWADPLFTASEKQELAGSYLRALRSVEVDAAGRIAFSERAFYELVSGGPPAFQGEWVYYNQGDPQWQSPDYLVGGGTIGSSGCGTTCLAMVWATYSGDRSIDPLTVLSMGRERGVLDSANLLYPSQIPGASEEFGLRGYHAQYAQEGDWEAAADAIGRGGCAIANIASSGPSEGYAFATSGHFVVWAGLSEDGRTAYLADPGSRSATWSEIEDAGEAKLDIPLELLKSLVAKAPYPQLVILEPM